MKDYLSFEQKAGLIVTSFLCTIIAGVLVIYLKNPYWIAFCIINIICWGIFGLFLFVTFLVKFVELRTNPELQRENEKQQRIIEKLERKYGKLEDNELKLIGG